MQVVPLVATPNQTLAVQLAGQAVRLNVYQKNYGLFMDVYLETQVDPIVAGVLCEDANRIVREAYLGFIGDFIFVDTQGSNDPDYTEIGARYQLLYLEVADLQGTSSV